MRRQDPRQRNNYYKIPDKYYVINPSGKFQNNGYVLSEGMQSWNKGSIYIHDEELPEFGYTSITSDVEDKYRIGSDYYIQEGTKQYRRYPTYDEKIQIFQAGGISKADVNNPNYYFLEKESDKKIYYSKFLNHNGYTLLPTKYEEIKSLGNNLFLTKINNRLGLVYATPKSLKTGKFRIFDNVFEEIIKNNDGTFKVKLNGDYFVVDFYGNILM